MTILDTIIAKKHQVVKELYARQDELIMEEKSTIKRSLIERLENSTNLSIIAEFKRASPSKGDINILLDPEKQAKLYEQFGADAISVLTDTPFFKGTYQDLEAVRKAVDVPILCKDFIIDSIQIDFAKYYGADIILLIVAALDDEQLQRLYNYATEKELEVLIEVHNEEELQRALKTSAKLIGVNNRNLKTFEVSLNTTEQLAAIIQKNNRYLVSESGISTMEDVERVTAAGAKAILVGETFMVATNLEQTLKDMKVSLKV